MIIVDDREPDDIARHLQHYGVDTVTQRLEFGDAMFEGYGPNGTQLIGFERKYITDLVESMMSRRLSGHQLGGMTRTYEVCYLLVEGIWRPSSDSDSIDVMDWKGRWTPLFHHRSSVSYQQVDSFLDEIGESGITVIRANNMIETAAIYRSRYRHWQKPYDQRRSMKLIYTPELAQMNTGKARFHFRKPKFIHQVGSLLPGVDMKAWDLDKFFSSPREMANANYETWRQFLQIKTKCSKTISKIMDTWDGKQC